MKKRDCNICGKKEIPLNETIRIDEKVYCSVCLESNFSTEKELQGKKVEREIDSTICSSCNRDFGNIELNKISSYPICNECEIKIKNKTLPAWVKGFFVTVMLIVIFSFIWNWKFYQAYSNIKKSNQYLEQGNYHDAALLMTSASEKVPEVEDLKTLSAYYKGIDFLAKDKNSEALIEFNKCKSELPADYKINSFIIQARIGIAFDNKNYEEFLEAAKENLALDSTLASPLTSVASAYACIYASKGDEDAKRQAIKYLDRAKSIDSTSREMKEYYNMIEYRIDARKIIKQEEFIKQFPNGWTKN